MSIRVVCPNGHVLNVKDALAGKSGLCPRCKARVSVPKPPETAISEDAILDILGPHTPQSLAEAPVEPGRSAGDLSRQTGKKLTPKKSCHRCNREISAEIHICPFCHTYIAELSDF